MSKLLLNVLLCYGGDEGNALREDLVRYLEGSMASRLVGRDIKVKMVVDEPSHSEGIINSRVENYVDNCDKCIALLTPDEPRSKCGSPNVLYEIGFWHGRKNKDSLIIVKHPSVDMPSNLDGLIFISQDDPKHMIKILDALKTNLSNSHNKSYKNDNKVIDEIIYSLESYDFDKYHSRIVFSEFLGKVLDPRSLPTVIFEEASELKLLIDKLILEKSTESRFDFLYAKDSFLRNHSD